MICSGRDSLIYSGRDGVICSGRDSVICSGRDSVIFTSSLFRKFNQIYHTISHDLHTKKKVFS